MPIEAVTRKLLDFLNITLTKKLGDITKFKIGDLFYAEILNNFSLVK